MRKRTIDLVVSAIATVVAFGLSWPYWRDFEYWPESRALWVVYFVVGFALSLYVFYVFLMVMHTLFEHDALDHAGKAGAEDES